MWGGPQFTQQVKFLQRGVECIDFSPCERYLATFSPRAEGNDKKLVMWDILTGQEKRSFSPEGANIWPIFKWSYNDKYVAYMGENILSVFETPVSL